MQRNQIGELAEIETTNVGMFDTQQLQGAWQAQGVQGTLIISTCALSTALCRKFKDLQVGTHRGINALKVVAKKMQMLQFLVVGQIQLFDIHEAVAFEIGQFREGTQV